MPARDLSELRVESWSIVGFVVKIFPRLENLFDIIQGAPGHRDGNAAFMRQRACAIECPAG